MEYLFLVLANFYLQFFQLNTLIDPMSDFQVMGIKSYNI